jgi:hypothetical protein
VVEAGGDRAQTFEVPLAELAGIDPARLREVAFIFDRRNAGEIWLDDVGFRD